MKNVLAGMWHGLGTTGRILVACFLVYFIGKALQKH